ncbi:hypothetical protein [Hydrogenophaga sp. PAMC20947]|nr:hypothetical protein [Hydrogenophaga sp. PAMC20947]
MVGSLRKNEKGKEMGRNPNAAKVERHALDMAHSGWLGRISGQFV